MHVCTAIACTALPSSHCLGRCCYTCNHLLNKHFAEPCRLQMSHWLESISGGCCILVCLADLSASEAHLHSNGCIPLQQVLLPHLVPPEGCLQSSGCCMSLLQLCICSACLHAFHSCLNCNSSPALPKEGPAILQHTPCALDDQHRPAQQYAGLRCGPAVI